MNEQVLDVLMAAAFLSALVAGIALYAFCLVDLHKLPVKYQSRRSVWLNLIWAAPFIGCLIYLANRKKIRQEADTAF